MCRMENGGAAQGFLNSIRGWYEFVAENMFIQSQGLLDQGLLSRFGGLGPQNSAMGCQIHLGRGFWPTQFYKTNCIPKSTRIRPWKSESQRDWAQGGAADLGERVAWLARQAKAFQNGLGRHFSRAYRKNRFCGRFGPSRIGCFQKQVLELSIQVPLQLGLRHDKVWIG